MNFAILNKNDFVCAIVNSDNQVIYDEQSALDLFINAKYNVGTQNIIIDKSLIIEDFYFK